MVKPQRLQKYIAGCGICSRRKAELLIEAGQVMVNGQKATLGMSVTETDKVTINGKPITVLDHPHETYLVYKPRGYTSTVSDRFAEQLVTDLIPTKARIFPVGRLDKDSEGLIILTNDGELANKMTHPSYQIEKIYHVVLDQEFNPSDLRFLEEGINDDGEFLTADKIEQTEYPNELRITLHHGKKRHIRRMLSSLDYRVTRLIRTEIGTLKLATLRGGPYLALTDTMIDQLLSTCLKPSS